MSIAIICICDTFCLTDNLLNDELFYIVICNNSNNSNNSNNRKNIEFLDKTPNCAVRKYYHKAIKWSIKNNMIFNKYLFINYSDIKITKLNVLWYDEFISKLSSKVKVTTCAMNNNITYLDSDIFATDLVGMHILMINGFFSSAIKNDTTYLDIQKNEIHISNIFTKMGYEIAFCDPSPIFNVMANNKTTNVNPYWPIMPHHRNHVCVMPDFDSTYSESCTGLCNQLRMIILNIIIHTLNGKKYFILDSFKTCIFAATICPINKIFNLDTINKTLNNIPIFKNIILFDRSQIDTNILSALYGSYYKSIEVTEKIKTLSNDTSLLFNNPFTMNNVLSDPCPGIKKKLCVKYCINGNIIEDIIDEHRGKWSQSLNSVYLRSFLFNDYKELYYLAENVNQDLLLQVIQSIRFTDPFYNIVNEIIEKFAIDENTIFIHFRIEIDAINHWSKMNKIPCDEFEQKLVDHYTNIMDKYVDIGNKCYILCHDEEKILSKFPSKYNPIYAGTNLKNDLLMKWFGSTGRELSAIIDFLIAIRCKKLFIGCYNYKLARGSSFSYFIGKSINCKQIMIDLDAIANNYEIY